MGQIKKKFSKKSKKKKVEDDDFSDEEHDTNPDNYDIEASDDEIDATPPKWHDQFPREKVRKDEFDESLARSLRQEAEMVLEEETNTYKNNLLESKKSERQWMMTMAKSGTSSDKVAALALMVQESPVHNLSSLTALVNMAKVSKKHQFILVLETLTELFISDLLRPSKKLRKFNKQPLSRLPEICENDNNIRRKRLCFWLFEEKLKMVYEQFVHLLNEAAHDSVQSNREKAVGSMLRLLQGNREYEEILIANLINKFGDPVHKVSSRVVYGLEKVIARHPKMKEDMLNEVEKMLFRSHISKRSQYYGICFLSQYKLSGPDKELCKRLIVLYFSFFKACVKTGDIDSRLMGALLVGVNRAYPYASRGKSSEPIIPVEHIDTMYRVVHFAPFKISLQALALLLQVDNNDRFYNALYKKLCDKELIQTSHQAIWINLVLKAIRKDTNDNRRKSFIKRILQVCLYFPVQFICGTLVMLSQIMKTIPDISTNFKFSEETEVKEEPEENDMLSNLKRFDENDEDEKYDDVKTEEEKLSQKNNPPVATQSTSVGSSWFHRDLCVTKLEPVRAEKKHKDPVSFDSLHRNPAYAGGEKSVVVELLALRNHFHPTVSLFAQKILRGERIHYTGDPLKDFTTLHFLDRFSFRNPKKAKDRGEDAEELFRAVGSQRKHYNPTGIKALAVQSDQYLNQNESAIPVDELFLYKYLKEKRKPKEGLKKQGDDSDSSDAESVGSVEFNDYLDSMMTGKKSAKALDFAEDVETTKSTKKDRDKKGDDDGSNDDDSDDELDETEDVEADDDDEIENEDEEVEEDGDEEEEDISDFDDEDDADLDKMDLSESEEDEEDKQLPLQSALRKRISRDFGNMAVPIEKFSEMLEEAGRSKSGGSHDMFNRDNASKKQLKWEESRMQQPWKAKKLKRNQSQPNQKWKGGNKKRKF